MGVTNYRYLLTSLYENNFDIFILKRIIDELKNKNIEGMTIEELKNHIKYVLEENKYNLIEESLDYFVEKVKREKFKKFVNSIFGISAFDYFFKKLKFDVYVYIQEKNAA
ncbi:MAG: hypothetical protein NZZ41_00915 [Candidatus Dojkabacteria bacterium]|nr:hypothetical protein [Candidatus Dojkabacteria bacterium]